MRWWAVVASGGLIAGCAARPPPKPVALHRPPHHTQPAAARPDAPAGTPVKLDQPTPAPEGPGSNVPLEGFRPLRTQTRPAA